MPTFNLQWEGFPNYTTKLTIANSSNEPVYYNIYPGSLGGIPMVVNKKEKLMFTDKMLVDNKFYVGSNSALERNWGHKTLEEAIAQATSIVNQKDGNESAFIVQIIKVVRRPQAPVEVKDI